MSTLQASKDRISAGQLVLAGLVILIWSTAWISASGIEGSSKGQPSIESVLIDASSEWPSGDPSAADSDPSVFFSPPRAPAKLCSLGFVKPPARLVSYPNLPQGPPLLIL